MEPHTAIDVMLLPPAYVSETLVQLKLVTSILGKYMVNLRIR